MQWTRDSFVIDDDRTRLDMPRILGWLAETYWAESVPSDEIGQSWEASAIVLGLYDGSELIGCARAVTDLTRIAFLSDVYLDQAHRGHGLGRWLVQTILDHPAVSDNARWMLRTSDAHGLYQQFGFEQVGETVMERPGKSAPGS